MTDEVPQANPPLSAAEESAVARLTAGDIASIDSAILSCALPRWQKVARIVVSTWKKLESSYPQLSYVFYAQRLRILAGQGRLESQGNLEYMRFSEVRIPDES